MSFNIDIKLDSDSKNRSAEIANTYLKTIGRRLKFTKRRKVRTKIAISPIVFERDPVSYPISFTPINERENFNGTVKDLARRFLVYGTLAEIFARKTGFNRGLGGSMHAFFTPFGVYPNNLENNITKNANSNTISEIDVLNLFN